MWGFIVYIVIGYMFYTFSYFYLTNEYDFPVEEDNFRKNSIIVAASLFIGLLWPLTLIKGMIFIINKYKNE